ncbi:MAG: hypothetical protein ABIP94_09095, partial [Planctomycetota bacterium]
MNVAVAAAVALACLGLWFVRGAPPAARLAAWAIVLGFAIAALDPRAVAFGECDARASSMALDGASATSVRTSALAAAAAAGPRVQDLTLSWSGSLDDVLGGLRDVAPGSVPGSALGSVP